MTSHNQRGAGTLLTLTFTLVLATALATAILWATISLTTHHLKAAADLTALSAAATLNNPSSEHAPCVTAHHIAEANITTLTNCTITGDTITVQVRTSLDLGALGNRQLMATARAGPS